MRRIIVDASGICPRQCGAFGGSRPVQQTTIVDLFGAAERLEREQELQKVAELYKTWIAIQRRRQIVACRLFQLCGSPGQGRRPRRRHRRLARMHQAEARLLSALHQSRPRARGCRPVGRPLLNGWPWSAACRRSTATPSGTSSWRSSRWAACWRASIKTAPPRMLSSKRSTSTLDSPRSCSTGSRCGSGNANGRPSALGVRRDARPCWRGISPLSLANLSDDPMFQLAQRLPIRQAAIGFPEVRARFDARRSGTARSGQAAHRLCLLRSARACRRLRHDRRAGDARPGAFRDLRLLLRYQPHRFDPGPHQEQRRPLDRYQRSQRRAGRPQDRRRRDRHPDRSQRLHQGCADQGVRSASRSRSM